MNIEFTGNYANTSTTTTTHPRAFKNILRMHAMMKKITVQQDTFVI